MESKNNCQTSESQSFSFISPVNSKELVFDIKNKDENNLEFKHMVEFLRISADVFPIFSDFSRKYLSSDDQISENDYSYIAREYNDISKNNPVFAEMLDGKYVDFADKKLLKFIIALSYSRGVNNPRDLNKYFPFSNRVYGEISFDCMNLIFPELHLKEDIRFIDLGSGVGQVVVQLAGSFRCKTCIGIEIAQIPYNYSLRLSTEFRYIMEFFGKYYSDFEILFGDFIDDKFSSFLFNSNFIFGNNFLYGAKINHLLQLKFRELPNGCKIVSTSSFLPLNFRLSQRTANDLGAVTRIRILNFDCTDLVSWTHKPVPFFLHEIDNSLLTDFLYANQHRKPIPKKEKGAPKISNKSRKRNSVNRNVLPIIMESTPLDPILKENIFTEKIKNRASLEQLVDFPVTPPPEKINNSIPILPKKSLPTESIKIAPTPPRLSVYNSQRPQAFEAQAQTITIPVHVYNKLISMIVPQNNLLPLNSSLSTSISQVHAQPPALVKSVAECESIKKNGIRTNGIYSATATSHKSNYVLSESQSQLPSSGPKNIHLPKLQSSEVSFKNNYDKVVYNFDKAMASFIDLGADLANTSASPYSSIMSLPMRRFHSIREQMDIFKDDIIKFTHTTFNECNGSTLPPTTSNLLDPQSNQH